MIERLAALTEGLKSTPGLLAVVVLQFVTMALVYFVATGNAERQRAWDMAIIDKCFDGTKSLPPGL